MFEGKITVFITILITRLQDHTQADSHTHWKTQRCGIRIRLTSRSRLVVVLQCCRKPTRKQAFVLPRLREDYGALKMTIKHGREWKRRRRADWLSGNQQKANQRVKNVIMSLGFVQSGTLSAVADRVKIIQTLCDKRQRSSDAFKHVSVATKMRAKLISVGHCSQTTGEHGEMETKLCLKVS